MATLTKPGFWRNYAILTPSTPGQTLTAIDKALVQDAYKTYGALLFRGFPLDLDIFREITQAYCTHAVFNESGGRQLVDDEQVIQTVNEGARPFPLHPELSREPWKPDVCWFGCLIPPKSGGQTLICDGTTIVEKLPARVFRAFENRRLVYTRTTAPAELEYWLGSADITDERLQNPPEDCPFSYKWIDGEIYRSFSRPVLHKPMFSDKLCFGNFLLFSRYHNNNYAFATFEDGSIVPATLTRSVKWIGDRCSVPIRWRANDLVMLDNTRFMHGRRRIKDTNHRYILSNFGYLNFAAAIEEEGPSPRWRNPQAWRNVAMA